MKTTARQTSARAPEAKERSRKTGSMPAQRLSVDPKAGAPVKHSDSKALPDMPMVDAPAETSAPSAQELLEYQRDFFERSILFWDTLRKRANNMLEHERAGMPPQQALGWIPVVYSDTADLKKAGQRIVYLTNPHVGHLGIFVSASVARLEHRAILESLADIEALAAGLYEMKIDNPTGDPDCHKPAFSVRFEPRRVEDLQQDTPNEAFERVKQTSEFNESMYRTFVSPWVQTLATPWTAEMLKWLHPMRSSRYLFSESFNPWMRGVAALAEPLATSRHPLANSNPLIEHEREAVGEVTQALEKVRETRDATYEQVFKLIFEQPEMLATLWRGMGPTAVNAPPSVWN